MIKRSKTLDGEVVFAEGGLLNWSCRDLMKFVNFLCVIVHMIVCVRSVCEHVHVVFVCAAADSCVVVRCIFIGRIFLLK